MLVMDVHLKMPLLPSVLTLSSQTHSHTGSSEFGTRFGTAVGGTCSLGPLQTVNPDSNLSTLQIRLDIPKRRNQTFNPNYAK